MVWPPTSAVVLVVVCFEYFVSPLSSTAAEPAAASLPSPLQVLATEAPNAASWVLAPLGQPLPPNIRQNLTLLKEDLADEAKVKPVATVNAYQLGFRLCSELIAALDQRDISEVHAGYRTAQINNAPLVTNQALDVRRNYQMSWPQYAREQDQRAAIEKQNNGKANVQLEQIKVQWTERTVAARRGIDALYSQYRDALRATPAVLAAPVPPASPRVVTSVTPAPASPPVSVAALNHPSAAKLSPSGNKPASPPSASRSIRSIEDAPGGAGHAALAFNGKDNFVFESAVRESLSADEMQVVEGLKIGEIGIPKRRGLTYFNLYTVIDNASPLGVLEKQLTAEVRVLCLDADGATNVTVMSKALKIAARGPQYIELAGRTTLETIRLRNNNDEVPKNAYVAFKFNNKIFREVLLDESGEKDWWRREELIRPE